MGDQVSIQLPEGKLTSGFGPRELFGRKFHSGVDIVPVNRGLQAGIAGVLEMKVNCDGGLLARITGEDGTQVVYGHLQMVLPASRVEVGQPFAVSGNSGLSTTGPHVHVSVLRNGVLVDPLHYGRQILPGWDPGTVPLDSWRRKK